MRILIFIVLVGGCFFSANAQIRSGSFQIDGDLKQINISANADFGKFCTDMSVGYNISEERINYYHAELSMEPADIYFALEISRVTQQPMEEVVNIYKVKSTNGWGAIAKELGIKPGSPEFHTLKNNANTKSSKYKKSKDGKVKGGNNGNGKGRGPKK